MSTGLQLCRLSLLQTLSHGDWSGTFFIYHYTPFCSAGGIGNSGFEHGFDHRRDVSRVGHVIRKPFASECDDCILIGFAKIESKLDVWHMTSNLI
jgi:hypothetical protein